MLRGPSAVHNPASLHFRHGPLLIGWAQPVVKIGYGLLLLLFPLAHVLQPFRCHPPRSLLPRILPAPAIALPHLAGTLKPSRDTTGFWFPRGNGFPWLTGRFRCSLATACVPTATPATTGKPLTCVTGVCAAGGSGHGYGRSAGSGSVFPAKRACSMSSTSAAAIRSPIHRITGTAMELPKTL